MKKYIFLFAVSVFLLTRTCDAQSRVRTNIQQFESLIDNSFVNMKNIPAFSSCDSIQCFLPVETQILTNYTLTGWKKVYTQSSAPSSKKNAVRYTIESAQIQYPMMERESFLGEYFLVRKATLQGNYYLGENKTDSLYHFNISITDTIPLSERENVELPNVRFTTAPVPVEPFFSTLLEPVVGVTAIAVSVYLLFTVRKTN